MCSLTDHGSHAARGKMHFFSFQHPRDASLPAKGPPGHSKELARVVWGLVLPEGTPQNVEERDQGLSPTARGMGAAPAPGTHCPPGYGTSAWVWGSGAGLLRGIRAMSGPRMSRQGHGKACWWLSRYFVFSIVPHEPISIFIQEFYLRGSLLLADLGYSLISEPPSQGLILHFRAGRGVVVADKCHHQGVPHPALASLPKN